MFDAEFNIHEVKVNQRHLDDDACEMTANNVFIKKDGRTSFNSAGSYVACIGRLSCDKCRLVGYEGASSIKLDLGTRSGSVPSLTECARFVLSDISLPCQNPNNAAAQSNPGEEV